MVIKDLYSKASNWAMHMFDIHSSSLCNRAIDSALGGATTTDTLCYGIFISNYLFLGLMWLPVVKTRPTCYQEAGAHKDIASSVGHKSPHCMVSNTMWELCFLLNCRYQIGTD